MRALGCCLLLALPLPAQVLEWAPQPPWLIELQQTQQQMQQAPLGSLDQRVERAWRAALQTPQHPQFQTAAQVASSFYQLQGYDLKAEQILRQALAAAPEADMALRRNLMSQLASHFEGSQRLVQALAIREQLAKAPLPTAMVSNAPDYEANALAHLYERMGEFEKAEAAWKEIEIAAARSPEPSQSGLRQGTILMGRMLLGDYGAARQNVLADFHGRRGRTAEAEQMYQKALADADQGSSRSPWLAAADSYIGFLSQQGRMDEAVELTRQSIARIESLPDAHAIHMLLAKYQSLAGLLTQAGRPEEAVAVQRQAAAEAQARGSESPVYVQALGALAETLLQLNLLDEAEQAVARMQEAAAADTPNRQFHESMAAQMLARIRDLQNKPEEAARLRASAGVPDLNAPAEPVGRVTTLFDLLSPAQYAAVQGNAGAAIAAADQALALAPERIRTNPQEISAVISLAHMLIGQQQQEPARRVVAEALRMLTQGPDHPRVAEALGSVIPALTQLGMAADAEQAIQRQERILVSAKGTESMALNVVSQGRIALLQQDSNWLGTMEERKRVLARTESATGMGSHESLYAMREIAWAYPPIGNWPEEQRVLLELRERTVNLFGERGTDHAHLLQHIANRCSQNLQPDEALAWMDQAIEITRQLPDAAVQLPGMMENRAQIRQAKDAPRGGPFYAPGGMGGGVAHGAGAWFEASRFQRTDGTRLGAEEGVLIEPAGLISIERPVDTPQPASTPAPERP